MKIYVMRHGTTIWNEKGICQGHSNNRLSEKGKLQTTDIANKYKNLAFNVIYCSPLMRTIQTANIMNKFHNSPVIKDKRLIEVDKGVFTGRLKSNFTDKEKFLKAQHDKTCKMETNENVYLRCKSFIRDIKDKNYDNVLVITHNEIATIISDILDKKKIDLKDEKKLNRFKNAEIKSFEI